MQALNWALVGGGRGSQIGEAHRIASRLDGAFRLVAGALDVDSKRGQSFGREVGLEASRAYGDWRELLEAENGREDRPALVTIATPNSTHYEIARAFLEAGFDVLCEKPLTTTIDDAQDLVRVASESERLLAVNYGYSGYPMIRQARDMVAAGELGKIRVVVAEFAHGFHANAADADNPRVRWRYDPEQAGVSSAVADIGIHALHLASYVIGSKADRVTADFASCVEGRQLEDDALVSIRFENGTVGRLWASAVAVGQIHGLSLRVFGEKGGLRWTQEQPNQLYWSPLSGPVSILERGAEGLFGSSRIAVGHPEGMLEAFANVYGDLAEVIRARIDGREPGEAGFAYPTGEDGLHGVEFIHAAAESARTGRTVSLR